ncbi:MAG: Bax inhibitor-1 family protein [Sandaracinaceae bacterium]
MQLSQPQANRPGFAAIDASVDARAGFLVKTYLHLVMAIFAFTFLEIGIFRTGSDVVFMNALNTYLPGRLGQIVVLGLFMASGFVANRWARSSTSPAMAYAGLGLAVVAWSIMFIPMLSAAVHYTDPGLLPSAALTTLVLFGGLTGIVFLTRKDFSFLRGILGVATLGALGTIVASLVFDLSLGTLFSGAMVVLAGGYVLYDTSNVLHHYRTDQHVPAALALFGSIALMFWYVLRIFMSRD